MTLMRVKGLTRNPGAQQATLVLEDFGGGLRLAFVVSMNDANRLARVLGLAACRCVPVYELVIDLTTRVGVSVVRAVLDGEAAGIQATLVLGRGVPIVLRCHPADAVALALRTGSPIYATAAALDHACPLSKALADTPDAVSAPVESRDVASPDVARWLEGVRPDDFGPDEAR